MSRKVLADLKHFIRVLEALIEVALLATVFYFLWRNNYAGESTPVFLGRGKWMLSGLYAIEMLIMLKLCDGLMYGHQKMIDTFSSQIIASLITNFFTYWQLCLMSNRMIPAWTMLDVAGIDIVVCLICCYLYTLIYHKLYASHDMLLIYGNENALDLKFKMDKRRDRYTVTEVIFAKCGMDKIIEAIGRHDAVIINDIPGVDRNDIVKYCYENKVRTYLVPKISDIIIEGGQNITLFDTPLKLIKGRGLSIPQRIIKRTLDTIICSIAFILALPVMLIVALAIKIEDHGPVFYKQKRVTFNGRTFEILKFRSMIVDAEKGGYDMNMRANGKDPRITKVGSFIRATRIDELPQIINIIKGDMSIVGPRPERVENVEEYAKTIPEWHLREKVKGGLTGFAQIYGKYNTSPMDKTKMDIMYIENYSLMLDVKLILMTIRIIFSKESTEGFDVNDERKEKRRELVEQLTENEADKVK